MNSLEWKRNYGSKELMTIGGFQGTKIKVISTTGLPKNLGEILSQSSKVKIGRWFRVKMRLQHWP